MRESILAMMKVHVCQLQRFAGKCVSMVLVIPGAKLYTREVNSVISWCLRNSKDISLNGNLRSEIEYWRFIDSWTGFSKWRTEHHKQMIKYRSYLFWELLALQSLGSQVYNHRVDVLTDNMAVIYAWQNQGVKESTVE
ncbi:hypothetical protein KUTeg_020407 [Tegillarca granosa]|uniref:Uncharacterized protein n=1 Tax=Tegillarca granosa TaxID=220873 RepID=A0ABQ9ED31_TEGGR|nr:hypothetical protein KUTeg_020407 [Tegillarca granosa]